MSAGQRECGRAEHRGGEVCCSLHPSHSPDNVLPNKIRFHIHIHAAPASLSSHTFRISANGSNRRCVFPLSSFPLEHFVFLLSGRSHRRRRRPLNRWFVDSPHLIRYPLRSASCFLSFSGPPPLVLSGQHYKSAGAAKLLNHNHLNCESGRTLHFLRIKRRSRTNCRSKRGSFFGRGGKVSEYLVTFSVSVGSVLDRSEQIKWLHA